MVHALLYPTRCDLTFVRDNRVADQNRDCHRANAARHWSNPACDLFHSFSLHIANDLEIAALIFDLIDPDINHRSPWFDHVRAQKSCDANGNDNGRN